MLSQIDGGDGQEKAGRGLVRVVSKEFQPPSSTPRPGDYRIKFAGGLESGRKLGSVFYVHLFFLVCLVCLFCIPCVYPPSLLQCHEAFGGHLTMIQNFGGDGLSHYGVWFELHQADFFMV